MYILFTSSFNSLTLLQLSVYCFLRMNDLSLQNKRHRGCEGRDGEDIPIAVYVKIDPDPYRILCPIHRYHPVELTNHSSPHLVK